MRAPAPAPKLPAALFWILVFLLGADVGILAVNAAMMPYGGGGGMFLGWLFSVILVILCAAGVSKGLGDGNLLIIAVILFAVFDAVFGVMGGQIYKLGNVRETPVIPVAEADQAAYGKCDVFHFTDGHVLRRFAGLHVLRGTRGRRDVYDHVAPLVPEGWKDGDPVTAWVAWEGVSEFPPASWDKDFRGGYRTGSETAFKEIVDETAARRHLLSRAHAPLLVWKENPRQALQDAANAELWGLLGIDLLALLALLSPRFRRKRTA